MGARFSACSARDPQHRTALVIVIFIVGVPSFLLGSIPFGYLLVRIFRKRDIRNYGSGNIGATNVARTGSKRLAVATLLLDALKGYAAVAFAHWYAARATVEGSSGTYATFEKLTPDTIIMLTALAALCAILGHMFTPWLGFEGGKGVATAVGAFAAIAPRAILVSLALFIVVLVITRYVSLGSMVGAVAFPIACWWLAPDLRDPISMSLIAASSLLIVVRHRANIKRLLAGTESRLW
jgi:glycerol-3-phosphate acyltransferase PlsY